MDQLENFGDRRMTDTCLFCGGNPNTRDHIPPKILLDKPYPEQLNHVGVCYPCNNGLSHDEEYVACALDCAIAGSANPSAVGREKIRKALQHSPALAARLSQAFASGALIVEEDRVKRVLLKAARGHALFDLNVRLQDEPTSFVSTPFAVMSPDDRFRFEQMPPDAIIAEVGSRASQRVMIIELTVRGESGEEKKMQLLHHADWNEVQSGRYRYLAFSSRNATIVRIVLSEYLACEAVWED